jgi:hypothetical protein
MIVVVSFLCRVILFLGKVTLKMEAAQKRSANQVCPATKLIGASHLRIIPSSILTLFFFYRAVPYESVSLHFLVNPIEKPRLFVVVAWRLCQVIPARTVHVKSAAGYEGLESLYARPHLRGEALNWWAVKAVVCFLYISFRFLSTMGFLSFLNFFVSPLFCVSIRFTDVFSTYFVCVRA